MLKTFDCPKCGAPVTYDRQETPGLPDPKVRCNYCGSTLIVPDEIHGQPARVVNIDLRSITRSKSSKLIWMLRGDSRTDWTRGCAGDGWRPRAALLFSQSLG